MVSGRSRDDFKGSNGVLSCSFMGPIPCWKLTWTLLEGYPKKKLAIQPLPGRELLVSTSVSRWISISSSIGYIGSSLIVHYFRAKPQGADLSSELRPSHPNRINQGKPCTVSQHNPTIMDELQSELFFLLRRAFGSQPCPASLYSGAVASRPSICIFNTIHYPVSLSSLFPPTDLSLLHEQN